MGPSLAKAENRREFFRSAARYGVLGVLGVIAGFTARRSLRRGQSCINAGICSRCGVFSDCQLSQALSAKQARNNT